MAKSGETRTVAAMFGAVGGATKRSAKRPRHSSVSGSSFAECPVCFRPFHPALIQSHAAECAGVAESPDGRNAPPPDVSNDETPRRPDPEPTVEADAKRRNAAPCSLNLQII